MNQIAHIEGKFKNLSAQELLEVVNFYIDENRYNCTPEYIGFNDWNELTHFSGRFVREDVERYFENEYYNISTLKQFYKNWQ